MKAIIIDDERLARTELRKLLQEFPEIEIVDEASNAEEGIQKISFEKKKCRKRKKRENQS